MSPLASRARVLALAPALAAAVVVIGAPARARAQDPEVSRSSSSRKGKPTFDESDGFTDPRKRQLPRTHRFRLGIESYWIALNTVSSEDGTVSEKFHYAPLLLNVGYQAQFLRRLMFRASLGLGGNVANTRNAMPFTINPRGHFGYQGTWFGAAFNYGYLFNIPRAKDAENGDPNALGQPIILKTHSLGPELSATSRIDRVAIQLAVGLNFTKSELQSYALKAERWRPTVTIGLGFFFDGSIRRARREKQSQTASR